MELQGESVDGRWETSYDNGMDYFIINDAIIQKICILGDDVEPCFEGASVTAPNVSTSFTLDENFKHTLFSMMQDLKNALEKGGQQMDNLDNPEIVEEEVSETEFEAEETETSNVSENSEIENTSTSEDYTAEEEASTNEDAATEEEAIENEASTDYEAIQSELEELKNAYSLL
jgi:hypothetical protein